MFSVTCLNDFKVLNVTLESACDVGQHNISGGGIYN